MKKFLYIFLLMGIMMPISIFAQDIVDVPNDFNQGTLNTAIDNVQADSVNGVPQRTNTIFRLARGGYYILNGTITLARGTNYTIEGEPAPQTGPDPGPPIIIPGTVLGGYYNYQIHCFGDLTLKNLWWIYAYQSGAQDWTVIQFEENGQPNAHGYFENVIFDYVRAIAVTSNRNGFIGTWKNCIFRNCIDPTQWWAGRMFATVSNTVTTDSIYADNCTFENMGFAFQTDYIPPKSVWFNHCTFLNIAKFTFKFYYITNLMCTNSIFVNNHFTGERYSDRLGQDPDLYLYGAVLDVDTINVQNGSPAPDYNNVKEEDRVVIFYNNSNFTDPMFQNFYDSYNDTVSTGLKGLIQAEPMMNERTVDMFNWHPHMRMGNVYDETDPAFIAPATNTDSIMGFLYNRYVPTSKGGGQNVFWGFQPDSTLLGKWPIHENLTYTNSTLMSAGMGGYPLGDLYHWFPAQYDSWKAQQASEDNFIFNLTDVKNETGIVPVKFSLEQNYPNPFNPTTNIKYSISKSGLTTLKVYNLLGQEIQTLFSGYQQTGTYDVTFNAINLASGVYFYRLENGNSTLIRKMVLMK